MKNKFFVNFIVGFAKIMGFIPTTLFFKPKIKRENGAKRGLPKPCIVVSNHKSLMDFALYQMVFPFRTIHFLMAEVLYNKSKFFAFLLNSVGGIRVDRDDKDFSFVSESLEVLDAKGTVGIFPEGRLPVKGKAFPFTTSTAFIAKHTDAPIIPVYTDGNYGLFKRARVYIGKPIYLWEHTKEGLSDSEQIEYLTRFLEQKVNSLPNDIEG